MIAPEEKLTIGWQDDRTVTIDLYVANVQAVTSTGGGATPTLLVFRAMPNPFTSGLAIELGTLSAILIHDVSGSLVRRFAAIGPRLIWDGRDSRGQEVPAGIYFLRLPVGAASIKVARVE